MPSLSVSLLLPLQPLHRAVRPSLGFLTFECPKIRTTRSGRTSLRSQCQFPTILNRIRRVADSQALGFSSSRDDTFLILSKAKGWWVVQRDPTGQGQTQPSSSLAGWVPAGCLLELSRPPSSSGPFGVPDGAGSAGPTTTTRGTLRLAEVVSTSYPGVALMSYAKTGGDEMDLSKDDIMWVFKRYSHWSYVCCLPFSLLFSTPFCLRAWGWSLTEFCHSPSTQAIKEGTGERGWVPSWFIGSQPPSSTAGGEEGSVPQTPRITGSPSGKTMDGGGGGGLEGSGGAQRV